MNWTFWCVSRLEGLFLTFRRDVQFDFSPETSATRQLAVNPERI